MKIGIDATWLPRDKRGMGMVVRNFLQGFQALESGHQLHFLTCKAKALPAIRQEVGALGPVTTFKEAPSDLEVAWYPWNRIDVPLPCAKVLTVHESLEFLGKWPPRYRNWSALYPQIEKIAVVSDTECHLVQSRLGDPQHKVVTCHNAISPKFLTPSQSQALAPAEGAENYRQTYSQGKPYLLFVGDPQEERKNLYGLLQALEKLPHLKEYRVMVAGILPRGPRPWWQRLWKPAYPPYWQKVLDLLPQVGGAERLIWRGNLDLEEMIKAYSYASCFAAVSTHETFFLPLIEALACATPTVCNSTKVLQEVGGGTAPFYYQENDIEDLAIKLDQILAQPAFASEVERHKRAGLERDQKFSPSLCAKRYLELFQEALAQH